MQEWKSQDNWQWFFYFFLFSRWVSAPSSVIYTQLFHHSHCVNVNVYVINDRQSSINELERKAHLGNLLYENNKCMLSHFSVPCIFWLSRTIFEIQFFSTISLNPFFFNFSSNSPNWKYAQRLSQFYLMLWCIIMIKNLLVMFMMRNGSRTPCTSMSTRFESEVISSFSSFLQYTVNI